MGNGQWAMGNGQWAMGNGNLELVMINSFRAPCPMPHSRFILHLNDLQIVGDDVVVDDDEVRDLWLLVGKEFLPVRE
jgi:hypothetical protein